MNYEDNLVITEKNYFESSFGCFQGISKGLMKQFLKCPLKKGASIKIGNRIWIFDFLSYNERYDCLSLYWVSSDKKLLTRISDHWSGRNGLKNIAKCFWSIKNPTKTCTKFSCKAEGWGKSMSFTLTGGLISFDKMESIAD